MLALRRLLGAHAWIVARLGPRLGDADGSSMFVPDGIGAIVAGGKTWPVVDNVAVAVVSYGAGLRYLQRAGSARGMRAYGFLNVR